MGSMVFQRKGPDSSFIAAWIWKNHKIQCPERVAENMRPILSPVAGEFVAFEEIKVVPPPADDKARDAGHGRKLAAEIYENLRAMRNEARAEYMDGKSWSAIFRVRKIDAILERYEVMPKEAFDGDLTDGAAQILNRMIDLMEEVIGIKTR